MFTYVLLKNLPDVPEKFIISALESLNYVDTDRPEDNLTDS